MRKLIYLIIVISIFSCNNRSETETNTIIPDAINEVTGLKSVSSYAKDTTSRQQDLIYEQLEDKPFTEEDSKLSGLANLFKSYEKPLQSFIVKSDENKTIICDEGTQISIKANSFTTKSQNPVNGNVEIQVNEFYRTSDILLSNLSTKSGDEILETGGMIYIQASHKGERCELKKGASIAILFPTNNKKEGMELFNGEWVSDQINWTMDTTRMTFIEERTIFSKVETNPEFPGGELKLREFLANRIKYPVFAIERGIQGTVYIGVTVNKTGETESVKVLKGLSSYTDSTALNALKQIPKWIPARHKGKNVRVICTIPVKFSLGNINNYEISNQIGIDSIEYWIDGNIKKQIEFETDLENGFTKDDFSNVDVSDLNKYILSSRKLGWINCDRFYYDRSPKIDYIVNIDNTKNVDIKIVFENINSILTGSNEGQFYNFKNVPIGQNITIIAIKYENKKYSLAVKRTIISKGGESDLVFETMTKESLKTEMEKLNKL